MSVMQVIARFSEASSGKVISIEDHAETGRLTVNVEGDETFSASKRSLANPTRPQVAIRGMADHIVSLRAELIDRGRKIEEAEAALAAQRETYAELDAECDEQKRVINEQFETITELKRTITALTESALASAQSLADDAATGLARAE